MLLPSWRPFVGRGYSSGLPPREDDWRPERAPWFASVASGRDLVATSCFIAKYTKVVRGYGPLLGQIFVVVSVRSIIDPITKGAYESDEAVNRIRISPPRLGVYVRVEERRPESRER